MRRLRTPRNRRVRPGAGADGRTSPSGCVAGRCRRRPSGTGEQPAVGRADGPQRQQRAQPRGEPGAAPRQQARRAPPRALSSEPDRIQRSCQSPPGKGCSQSSTSPAAACCRLRCATVGATSSPPASPTSSARDAPARDGSGASLCSSPGTSGVAGGSGPPRRAGSQEPAVVRAVRPCRVTDPSRTLRPDRPGHRSIRSTGPAPAWAGCSAPAPWR